jgi:hypothetical protein
MDHNIWNIGKVRVREANWSRHGAKEEEEGAKRDQSAICMCTIVSQTLLMVNASCPCHVRADNRCA